MSDIEKSSLSEIEERNGGVAITARVSGTVGTVGLIQDGEVALLPVPSDDPKGQPIPLERQICAC